jgi:peptidoglycan/xylan/chitin deacetylase (PgdA/CDA1 family)
MPIGRDVIKLRRGAKATIPTFEDGEIAFTQDEKALYVGTSDGNYRMPNQDDIDGINSQLAENANRFKTIQGNPNSHDGAVVTFIDDDADPLFKEIWEPIMAAKGIKMTLAVVTGRVGGSTSLTLQELKDLQADGNSILSHTKNHFQTSITPVETLEIEYQESQEWLDTNGFYGKDVLVYPGGLGDFSRTDVKNIARKYYRYAIATGGMLTGATYSSIPMDNWAIPRPNGDTQTEAQLKALIDTAIAENGWLVICMHSYELNKDKTNQITKINNLIDYCNSLGVAIMPFLEAEKYKGNTVAMGEYTDNTGTFISNNGLSKIGGSLIIPNTARTTMDAPITSFKKNTKTIQILDSVADTFLATGGIMETFRGLSDLYSYQTFKPYNSSKRYDRLWNYTTKVWGVWEAKQYYTTGFWTPVLKGATVAGTHTYTYQEGSYTKIANMVTVRFHIRILAENLDAAMAGNLQIHGLPIARLSGATAVERATVEYGNLTLGPNYTSVFLGTQAGSTMLELYKQGSNVGNNYLKAADLTAGQIVVFRGSITYQIAE